MGSKWWVDLQMALVRKVVVGSIGFPVLFAGIAMIVLPGPAVIVIPLGLAILATEFDWAKAILNKARERLAPPNEKKSAANKQRVNVIE